MALPPTIPTSFVPHPSSSANRGYRLDFIGAFTFFCYFILVIVLALAAGVFAYGRVLLNTKASKDDALVQAEANIDAETAHSFIRLHDRLSSSAQLLDQHNAFSSFFKAVETILPSTVRFTQLHITTGADGKTALTGNGVAKSFNALAATSASLGADGRIKDAIFSHIAVNDDNSVTFQLSASVSQDLIAFSPSVAPASVAPAVVASTTVATTTP